jgi:Lectin C-type domain
VRIRRAAFLAAISACGLAAACIPDLLTDPLPDAAPPPQIGAFCGDGIITLGQYDGGFADPKAGEACDPSEAGAIGCTRDCKIDCDGGYVDPVTNHCYFKAIQATALDTAEQSCEAANGHVVSFLDDRERFGVLGSPGAPSAYWVNLSLNPELAAYTPATPNPQQEPGWLPTCSGCYAAPNVQDGGIPRLVLDAGGSCVIDIGALGWSQLPCTQIAKGVAVICEREPPGSLAAPCNGGTCLTLPQTKGRKHYFFGPVPVTADAAEQACDGFRNGAGSLVVFESLEERETLLRELVRASNDLPVKEAWIGLSSTSASPDASFIWDDDGGMTASPWGDSQPSWDASAPLRAFVRLGVDNYDVQLAHVDTTQTLRPYICQY